eukprot:scaffold1508_cov178-Amphora_coffeaeformis.AAC.10
MNNPAATTVPPAPAPPPPPPQPAADDDRREEGTAISTFTGYQPSALPPSIIAAFNTAAAATATGTSADSSIEVDDDNDDDDDDDSDDSQQQRQLQVPSHTSAACESNLLSTVVAPAMSNDVAACLMPLIPSSNTTTTTTHANSQQSQSPALSPLQFEGVLLALQRHCRIFTSSGERAGFFLGDGAGIGKGTCECFSLLDQAVKLPPFCAIAFVANQITTIAAAAAAMITADTPNDTCGFRFREN